MGQPKQLLPLGAKPVIRHCLDTLFASGITSVVVVIGPYEEEMRRALQDLPLVITINKNNESEMADSVKIGLRATTELSSGVLVCLSDHPLVSVDTLKVLIHWHYKEPDKIIIPRYAGKRGHPCVFPRSVLKEASRGMTLRDIVNKDEQRVQYIDVRDKGILLDMDTQEDYQRIAQIISKKSR